MKYKRASVERAIALLDSGQWTEDCDPAVGMVPNWAVRRNPLSSRVTIRTPRGDVECLPGGVANVLRTAWVQDARVRIRNKLGRGTGAHECLKCGVLVENERVSYCLACGDWEAVLDRLLREEPIYRKKPLSLSVRLGKEVAPVEVPTMAFWSALNQRGIDIAPYGFWVFSAGGIERSDANGSNIDQKASLPSWFGSLRSARHG